LYLLAEPFITLTGKEYVKRQFKNLYLVIDFGQE
jgi:hypothetical protein